MEQPCPACGGPAHSGPCVISADDWNQTSSPLDDLRAFAERLEREAREPLRPFIPDPGLARLAAAVAERYGLSPPPGASDLSGELEQLVNGFRDGRPRESGPLGLDPVLEWAIGRGVMSHGQARDLDAFADGLAARVRDGEITEEEGDDLAHAQAVRDAQAVLRARARGGNRRDRRAEAAQQRQQQRKPRS